MLVYFNAIKQIKERVIFLKGGILYAKVNKTKEPSRKSEVITHEKPHVFFITEMSRSKCAQHVMAKAGSWVGCPHLLIGFRPREGELTAQGLKGHSPPISGEKESTFHPALLPALSTHMCTCLHTHAHISTHAYTHMQMTGAALPSPGQWAGCTAGHTAPVAGGQAQSRSTIWQNLENSLLRIPRTTITQRPGHRSGCKAQEAAECPADKGHIRGEAGMRGKGEESGFSVPWVSPQVLLTRVKCSCPCRDQRQSRLQSQDTRHQHGVLREETDTLGSLAGPP